jgi:hypothetical protein
VAKKQADLELLEEVGRGSRYVAYKGRRRGQLVVVKVPCSS